ncbi:MAG: cytochrome c biogenesis protein CcdA [Thermodesulfobacteriota bacterium]
MAGHATPVLELSGRIEPDPQGGARVVAVADVARGYHVNAHRPSEDFLIPTELTLASRGVAFDEPQYPTPTAQRFAFAGDEPLLVYAGRFEIVARAASAPAEPVELRLRYQACDDERCLPPATALATLRPGDGSVASVAPVGASGSARAAAVDPNATGLTRWLEGASLPTALLVTLVLGLTLNLTPCVYPLVSVTIGYFGSQSRTTERARALPLAVAYVLGITVSFAVLGVSAALFGGLFGAPLQHPALLIGLAVLMLALAGASFGFYEIRAPAALVNKVGGASAGIGGAAVMGLTMGIVAAPCIGPVILGLLVYVGAQRDALLGFLLFFTLGLGMGLPYVLLASAAGAIRRLPRSGEWLAWVNRLFGTLLVGMALYFVSPLLDGAVLRVAVPLYLAAAGLYLGFVERSARAVRWFSVGRRALGAAVVLLAVWIALPSAQAREGIRWQPLAERSLDHAAASRRPALVEFAADWCLPCLEMKRTTFVDPGVTREAAHFATFVADVTESTPENDALLAEFRVIGVPTIIAYGADGAEVERLVGFVDGETLVRVMQRARRGSGDADAPSLTRLGEQGGDVVAAEGRIGSADHVRAERVHLEAVGRAEVAHEVVEAGRHQ